MNLAELLAASARAHPDAPALVSGDTIRCDHGTLARRVAARAGYLRDRHGVRPGDRVGLFATNSPDYLEHLLSIWWAGGVAVPLSAMLHPREATELLVDSSVRLCVTSPDRADGLSERCPTNQHLLVVGGPEEAAALAADPVDVAEVDANDDAWIFYTSGTTGRPKGARLTHRNLTAMTLAYLADVEPVDVDQGLLHLGLMSHAGGLFALPFLARAARQVVPESAGVDPAEVAGLLAAHRRLSFFVPPVLLRRLCAAPQVRAVPPESLGTVLLGAAPVRPDDLRAGLAVFGPRVWHGYGQGETPCTITAMSARAVAAAAGDEALLSSVGIPRIATLVRVVDAEDRRLPDGEVGEVVVRGPTVMAGYLGRPEATARTLRGGWLHTGDLGRMDRGHLTLLGRSKDLVITGGANVYPKEVEDALVGHPDVAEVAVVGVPDPEWGERVVAFVVPAPGAVPDPGDLDARCLATIARYKRPKEYHIVASLPRNGAGKVLKPTLREQLARPDQPE
ncbi:MAG TPA: AMP-binding protein [Mycobacteriales bacterium]